jgi:hypothetical protein
VAAEPLAVAAPGAKRERAQTFGALRSAEYECKQKLVVTHDGVPKLGSRESSHASSKLTGQGFFWGGRRADRRRMCEPRCSRHGPVD